MPSLASISATREVTMIQLRKCGRYDAVWVNLLKPCIRSSLSSRAKMMASTVPKNRFISDMASVLRIAFQNSLSVKRKVN